MNTQSHPASGAASAHRYDLAPSTTVFKTRLKPCRIAVRADIKKSRPSTEKRPRFAAIWATLSTDLSRILALGVAPLRFSAHCRLKTADSERSSELLFPIGTGRSNWNGLLEHMP